MKFTLVFPTLFLFNTLDSRPAQGLRLVSSPTRLQTVSPVTESTTEGLSNVIPCEPISSTLFLLTSHKEGEFILKPKVTGRAVGQVQYCGSQNLIELTMQSLSGPIYAYSAKTGQNKYLMDLEGELYDMEYVGLAFVAKPRSGRPKSGVSRCKYVANTSVCGTRDIYVYKGDTDEDISSVVQSRTIGSFTTPGEPVGARKLEVNPDTAGGESNGFEALKIVMILLSTTLLFR